MSSGARDGIDWMESTKDGYDVRASFVVLLRSDSKGSTIFSCFTLTT